MSCIQFPSESLIGLLHYIEKIKHDALIFESEFEGTMRNHQSYYAYYTVVDDTFWIYLFP